MKTSAKALSVLLLLVVGLGAFVVRRTESAAVPDRDLTVMSATMIYSVVYDMTRNPMNYVGEKVKMKGTYAELYDDRTGTTYHTCVIKDATACCAQGIEFALAEGAEYPAVDSEIILLGTMDAYPNENIQLAKGIDPAKYGIITDICVLRDAELLTE